jgi:signal transduction histidine kinase
LFQDRWLTLANGTNYLVMVLPVKGAQDPSGYWFTAISEDHARQLLAKALSPVVLPDYFSLSVEVAGKSLISVKEPMQVLATVGRAASSVALKAPDMNASGIVDSPNDKSSAKSRDSIQLKIYLSDPQRFYARQQTRTIWFVSLIALSMCAVLVGFLAAWRAFRRQLKLNEMKSNFVSSVSHELRAPIASIGLMSEELEDIASQDPVTSRQYHQLIKRECRRLASLIENVLDFSRHEQGRKRYSFEAADMVALVEETVNLMRSYGTGQRVMLETKVQGQPLPAEVDVRAIQQALVNLIDNAIKHSPERANVLIGLEFDGAGGQPEKSGPVAQHQKHLRLWVEDDGPGIPPAEHEHIFERFYRRGSELRRETQGIGLGLAIVKYVTEAHGGRVIVRSAVGEGSRFTMELPMLNHETRT